MNWWETEDWRRYEEAYGDEPGTRAALLASVAWRTRVVDLKQTEVELWRGVRRSYHSIINGLTREYAGGSGARDVIGAPETLATALSRLSPYVAIDTAVLYAARRLHIERAGRETRPYSTWEKMAWWLTAGSAQVAVAFNPEGDLKGYAYFVVHNGWAYYHSSATSRRDLGLALIWWSMLGLKGRRVRWCELGWIGEARDKKGKGVEFVRRGWGGCDVPAAWSGRSLTQAEWDSFQ